MRKILFWFFVGTSCLGCGMFGAKEASRIKHPSPEAQVMESTVKRSELNLALGNELKTAMVRPVEVLQNASGFQQTFPNFRLFDIQPGSVYSLLGLQNADILVAIDERAVVSPQVLGQIMRLLPKEKGINFELLRGGKSIFMKVKFVD